MTPGVREQAWLNAANGLLAQTTSPALFFAAREKAAELVAPVLEACSALPDPYEHIVPLLVAAEIVAGLAVICGDNPVFLDVANALAQQLRLSGRLDQLSGGAPQ